MMDSCILEGQPLSKRSLRAIVESYKDGPQLMETIRQAQADQDFSTVFIKEHEGYAQLHGAHTSSVRTCHNLRQSKGGGELFLFIHGLGGTLEQFEPVLRELDQRNKSFLAFDLPGFGKSDEWDQYPMLDVAKSIDRLINELTNNQKFEKLNIIGHSMGCYLAVHFYLIFHKSWCISRLVLLAPPKPNVDQLSKSKYLIQFGLRTGFKFPWMFDIYRTRFDQSKGLSSSGIKQFFYRDGDVTDKYRKLWQFHNNVQIKSRSIFGYFLGWEEIDWNVLNKVLSDQDSKIKLLILCGEKDTITPEKYSREIYDLLSDVPSKEIITIPNCGHNLCFDSPEAVNQIFSDSILQ